MDVELAVIGCGNMGEGIIRGLIDQNFLRADQVIATHPREERRHELAKSLGIETLASNVEAARQAKVVLLGVKPQVIKIALRELMGQLEKEQRVITIAAGISTAFVESYLPTAHVVRAMPNLPVIVGRGVTAIAGGLNCVQEDLEYAERLFGCVGMVRLLPEDLLDAVTGTSGTGPTYVAHIVEALSDAGVRVGLPREVATEFALETLAGSVELLKRSEQHPAVLKDLVSSPGGTSITALHVLRRNAFQSILMDAVVAATQRSQELGRS